MIKAKIRMYNTQFGLTFIFCAISNEYNSQIGISASAKTLLLFYQNFTNKPIRIFRGVRQREGSDGNGDEIG